MKEVESAPEAAGAEPDGDWPDDGSHLGWSIVAAIVVMASCCLVALPAAGLPLAFAGWFRPALLWPLWAGVAGGLIVLARPWKLSVAGAGGAGRVPLLLGLVVISAATLVNINYASDRMWNARDPDIYVEMAWWIADDGDLVVEPQPGPFASSHDLTFLTAGTYGTSDPTELHYQFAHGLGVTMAAAKFIAGDRAMLPAVASIGGLAAMSVLLFSRRFVPGWLAAVVGASLALDLVHTHFSRTASSEIPSQVLMFAGLWLALSAADRGDRRRAFVAGALVAGAMMFRIDMALASASALLSLSYYRWTSYGDPCRCRNLDRVVVAYVGGALPVAFVSYLDVRFRSTGYWQSHGGEARLTYMVAAASAATYVVVAVSGRSPTARRIWDRTQVGLSRFLAVAVVVAAAFAWFVRPHVQTVYGLVGAEVVRLYSEDTMWWLSWYVGPIVLAAGILGFAVALLRSVGGRRRDLFAVVAAGLVWTVLFVERPRISPDQIWAMRRFLIFSIPMILLAAAVLLAEVWSRRARPGLSLNAAIVGAVSASMVLFPLYTQAPVYRDSHTNSQRQLILEVCDVIGADGVALTFPDAQRMMAAIRARCGVPVGELVPGYDIETPAGWAAAWAAEGRQLYLVGHPDAVGTIPGAREIGRFGARSDQELEQSFEERPDGYRSFERLVSVAILDPP